MQGGCVRRMCKEDCVTRIVQGGLRKEVCIRRIV